MKALAIVVGTIFFAMPVFSQEPAEEIKNLRAEISALKGALTKTEERLAGLEAKMAVATPRTVSVAEAKPPVQNQTPSPLTLSAKSYLGYRYGLNNAPNAFDIYRGYLGFSYRLTPRVTFTATIDTAARRDDKGYFEVVLKNLFLNFEYRKNHYLQIGQTNTAWVPYMEDLVGDRFVQTTFVETGGYGSSTDMGLVLKGALAQGRLQYHAGLFNGNGWHRPETNRSKDVEGRLTFMPLAVSRRWQKGIFASVGASRKFYSRSEVLALEPTTAYRLHILGGYQSKKMTAGVEMLNAADPVSKIAAFQSGIASLREANGRGYSVFANMKANALVGSLPENAGILFRFNIHDPTKNAMPGDSRTGLMLGPTWVVNKNLQFFTGYLGTRYGKAAGPQNLSTDLLVFSAEAKF